MTQGGLIMIAYSVPAGLCARDIRAYTWSRQAHVPTHWWPL